MTQSITQVVPNRLLFFLSSQTLVENNLSMMLLPSVHKPLPKRLACELIMYFVHLQHNCQAEHTLCTALLCSLPQFRHTHSSCSFKSCSFKIFSTVHFPPKNLPHKHSYSCSFTNASKCGRAGIFGTSTFGLSLQCLLCSPEYICN